MLIARVIPLRRLPRQRPWLDYDIPTSLDVRVGQLVEIPLRRQSVRGVVWAIVPDSAVERRSAILRVVLPEPILTDWQMKLLHIVHDQLLGDISAVVQSTLPHLPKHLPPSKVAPSSPTPNRVNHAPASTQWYRRRRDGIDMTVDWLTSARPPALIITPTHDDADQLMQAAQQTGLTVAVVDSRLTPAQYRAVYFGVLSGDIQYVIGTAQAALLPFSQPPMVCVDQAEHPSHRPLYWPKWDMLAALDQAEVETMVTTPAPTVAWYQHHAPTPPPPDARRQLASLNSKPVAPWLSQMSIDVLTSSTLERPVLVVVPRHGYAGAITCVQCGYSLACPVCQRRASLKGRPPAPVECTVCGQTSHVPASCPQCHGHEWKYGLIGQERVRELISRLGIQVNHGAEPAPVMVGTYQDYRWATRYTFAQTIVLHGDALLNWADFSAAERAWQYLHRLQTTVDCPLLVQTFSPDSPFWQRWLFGDDRAWYANELAERERLRLPPFTEQWMAQREEEPHQREFMEVLQTVTTALQGKATVETMPPQRRRNKIVHRLLITAQPGVLPSDFPWVEWFPTPWQVDTQVNTWLLA